jgi:hypothetical protein
MEASKPWLAFALTEKGYGPVELLDPWHKDLRAQIKPSGMHACSPTVH